MMYSMKMIPRFIGKSTECCLLPRTLSNTVMKAQESTCKGRTKDVKASSLHSHTKFMEASSNMVNINEINAISVFDLQSEYGKAKAKALGKKRIRWHCYDRFFSHHAILQIPCLSANL